MQTRNFFDQLIGLRPIVAFLIINAGVVAHTALTQYGYVNPALWSIGVIPAIPLFAWPCVAVSVLKNRHGASVRVQPRRLWTAFVGVLFAYAFFVPILAILPRSSIAFVACTFITWCVGFLGLLYVFWSAARVLVEIEERKQSSIDRILGTFLMYFFLPISILILQRRIQRAAKNED